MIENKPNHSKSCNNGPSCQTLIRYSGWTRAHPAVKAETQAKYKKMIEYCLKHNQKFGIVNSRNNDTLSIGCTAEITQITAAEGDTGEYDILVTGVERFIVKSYNYSKDYKQAYVKTWQDIDDSIDETLLQETNVFLYEVLMKLGASAKISQINMPNAAFEIASMLSPFMVWPFTVTISSPTFNPASSAGPSSMISVIICFPSQFSFNIIPIPPYSPVEMKRTSSIFSSG